MYFALLLLLAFNGLLANTEGRKEGSHRADRAPKDGAAQKRSSRSSDLKAGRCSYTFIVPQQKLKGALCVSRESAVGGAANHSEVASLRQELSRQQEQLERVRAQLEQEGAMASEVRALRRESGTMNARITQLYAQLLQEILQKKDQAQEQRRLENLLLNATSQVIWVCEEGPHKTILMFKTCIWFLGYLIDFTCSNVPIGTAGDQQLQRAREKV